MIYIFGDSHARFNFTDLELPNINLNESSITMHRIGRDSAIINLDQNYCSPDSIFVISYGEIDCRCHIGKQVRLGRSVDEVCNTLVDAYIKAITTNITSYKKIIICPVVPPMSNKKCILPSDFPYPMIGDDEERSKNTRHVNSLLKKACELHGFTYLDFYNHYTDLDGTLNYEYSDKIVHIQENEFICKLLAEQVLS
jgi:hypothetical protein